jgi:hypothetical protein
MMLVCSSGSLLSIFLKKDDGSSDESSQPTHSIDRRGSIDQTVQAEELAGATTENGAKCHSAG